MTSASMHLDPAFVIAPVRRRIFGSFVEHMGRCVYTGIYQPGHPTADAHGFRGDVLELVRELGVSVVRYPGGNFVSGYRWEDGIGPAAERPVRRDLAWHTLETNAVGIDEFATWAKHAELEVMYSFNLGTRGVQEALDAHEYMNHPKDTQLSDLRRKNGADAPYGVKLFCLGNEMDGPWQTGHKTAHEYGRLAAEVARALRTAEPDLELVACGSSSSAMPTFGAWEAEVLELSYDQVDYISAHAYYEELNGDLGSFLASGVNMDHFIDSVVATADSVGARLKNPKRIDISFDEWNVWYQSRYQQRGARGRLVRREAADRGCLHGRRRGRRRWAADLVVASQRPRRRRLSGAAGQRHRPDHDRPRRGGMAADHLPPLRHHLPARAGRRAPPRDAVRLVSHRPVRRRPAPGRDRHVRREQRRRHGVRGEPRHRGLPELSPRRSTGSVSLEVAEAWLIGGGDPYAANDRDEPDRVAPVSPGVGSGDRRHAPGRPPTRVLVCHPPADERAFLRCPRHRPAASPYPSQDGERRAGR